VVQYVERRKMHRLCTPHPSLNLASSTEQQAVRRVPRHLVTARSVLARARIRLCPAYTSPSCSWLTLQQQAIRSQLARRPTTRYLPTPLTPTCAHTHTRTGACSRACAWCGRRCGGWSRSRTSRAAAAAAGRPAAQAGHRSRRACRPRTLRAPTCRSAASRT